MKIVKIIVILMTLGLVVEAFSQPFHGNPPLDGPRHERIRERINTIRIWKLTEDLSLNEQQSEKFFPIYNAFESDKQDIEKQRLEIIRQLDDLTLKEKPSEEEINKLLDRLENLDQEIKTKRIEFRSKLKDILTARQIGRLYVFEIRFQRQIQEIIRDAKMEMREKFGKGR